MKVIAVFFALVAVASSGSVPLLLSSPTTTTLLRSAPVWDASSYVTSQHVGPAFAYSAFAGNAYSPYYSVIPSIPSYRHVVYVQPEPRYVTVDAPTLVQELGKAPVLTQGKPNVEAETPVFEVESPADDTEKVSVDEDTVSVETA